MSVARGDDLERRTVKHLRSLGYSAERVSRRARYGTKDLSPETLDSTSTVPAGEYYRGAAE